MVATPTSRLTAPARLRGEHHPEKPSGFTGISWCDCSSTRRGELGVSRSTEVQAQLSFRTISMRKPGRAAPSWKTISYSGQAEARAGQGDVAHHDRLSHEFLAPLSVTLIESDAPRVGRE